MILGAAVIDEFLALLLLGFVSSFAQGTVNLVDLAGTTLLAQLHGFVRIDFQTYAKVPNQDTQTGPRLGEFIRLDPAKHALADQDTSQDSPRTPGCWKRSHHSANVK